MRVRTATRPHGLRLALLLGGPSGTVRPSAADDPRAADLVIRHAKVITVDRDFRIAEAVAIRGDRVLAVGSNAEIARLTGPATRVIDAGGKALLPGLYDSHVHPLGAAHSEKDHAIPSFDSLDRRDDVLRRPGEGPAQGDVDRRAVRVPDPAEGGPVPDPRGAGSRRARPHGPAPGRTGRASSIRWPCGIPGSPATRPTRPPAGSSRTRRPASRPG